MPEKKETQTIWFKHKSAEAKTRTARTKRVAYTVWAVIGIVLLMLAVGYLLWQVRTALAIVALAAFVVFILRVPVAWMEKRGIPRLPGSLIAYLLAIFVITLFLVLFIPFIWEQIKGLIRLIPEYANDATIAFNNFYLQYNYLLDDSNIQQVFARAASDLSSWAMEVVSVSTKGVFEFGVNLLVGIVVFLISLVVGFWILKDLPKIGKEIRLLIGPKREEEAMFIASSFSKAFGGYLRGMTIAGTCTGLIAGIGYYFLGLPYPAVLGLLVGILNFIPYVGPWMAGILVALIALFISPVIALIAIILTIFAEQFVDNFVYPRVMSSVVDLHPAVVLIGVFTGGALGGPMGLICAVPLLGAAKAIFVYYFERRTGRILTQEAGAIFKTPASEIRKRKAALAVGEDIESTETRGIFAAKAKNWINSIKKAEDKREN